MHGKLILVYGPSGSGKGELISHVRKVFPEIVFARSQATRAMRPGEVNGDVYNFVSREDFDTKVEEGAFLEWAEFGGNRYGTLKAEVLPFLAEGKTVLKEMEVQGIRAVRAIIPEEQLAVIFISAGPWNNLEARIRSRAPISKEELEKRRLHYEDELSYRSEAHFEIENLDGKLEDAKKQIEDIVRQLLP